MCHIAAMKSVDPDCDNGELTIKIPSEASTLLQGKYCYSVEPFLIEMCNLLLKYFKTNSYI